VEDATRTPGLSQTCPVLRLFMYKIIQDPVNGPIKIDGLFSEIVDSEYFQRLRYIKQLGLCNLVFPGANHSRFEHSLGTMFMARELSASLDINDKTPEIAALLHDVGHMPFSHGIEDIFYSLYHVYHEDITRKIICGIYPYNDSTIPDILKKYGYEPTEIADVATGKSKKNILFSNMVSGAIDVDELDYLRRDALFCGVTMGQIDYKRLFNTLAIKGDDLVGVEKSIPTMESIIITRILMFNTVYFHKTIRIAQEMLGYAYLDMENKDISDIKLVDFQFIEKLLNGNSKAMVKKIMERKLFKVAYRCNYSENEMDKLKSVLSVFPGHEYIIDIIPPLYFAGSERIKNYAKVYYRGNLESINNVSSIAMSLSREMENKQIIVSTSENIYEKAKKLILQK
jgi:HD superfamily phosphohydrolase